MVYLFLSVAQANPVELPSFSGFLQVWAAEDSFARGDAVLQRTSQYTSAATLFLDGVPLGVIAPRAQFTVREIPAGEHVLTWKLGSIQVEESVKVNRR